jgi:hypothetical protein
MTYKMIIEDCTKSDSYTQAEFEYGSKSVKTVVVLEDVTDHETPNHGS